MKKCPKCRSEMFESMEPKVANLANDRSKLPDQRKYWRCGNPKCEFKENEEFFKKYPKKPKMKVKYVNSSKENVT